MKENPGQEMQGLQGEIADALGQTPKDKDIRGGRASPDFKAQRKTLILVGGGILLLLIILITLFSGGGNEFSTEGLIAIQTRLNQLEKGLTRLEGIEEKILVLIKQEKELLAYVAETDRSGKSLAQQFDKLTKKVDRLERIMGRAPAKTEAPLAIQRKPFPPAKGRYHKVRHGDTLYWIAQKYGTSVQELCRLNHISPKQVIYPGQKLLIAPEGNE